jgi:protease II
MRVYGFYGLLNEPTYNNIDLALLEKNWVIVYPHVRGGG